MAVERAKVLFSLVLWLLFPVFRLWLSQVLTHA